LSWATEEGRPRRERMPTIYGVAGRKPGLAVLLKANPYTLKELPQPQVDFTCGLLNLNPEPSRVST